MGSVWPFRAGVFGPFNHELTRAKRPFCNYVDCYSFSGTVKKEEKALRRREGNPKAFFKWPVQGPNSLADYYRKPTSLKDIGLPQGDAISCLISNLLLDFADKEVRLSAQRSGADLVYFRYCDGMIIVSPSEKACQDAFDAYVGALCVMKTTVSSADPVVFLWPRFL